MQMQTNRLDQAEAHYARAVMHLNNAERNLDRLEEQFYQMQIERHIYFALTLFVVVSGFIVIFYLVYCEW